MNQGDIPSSAKVIYLGACLIAAVRLAREEDWRSSPRVVSRIADAISLAQRIYDRMKIEYPSGKNGS